MSRAGDVTDVVIVGGGAAGLSLAHALTRPGAARPLSVALVETPRPSLRPAARTWCFWQEGPGDFDDALVASWRRLRVHGRDGEVVEGELGRLRYQMLRSDGFEALVGSRLAALPHVRLVEATAETVRNVAGGAEALCVTAEGDRVTLRGRHLFDSRPARSLPPARSTLLQHFEGWFVRTSAPAFDDEVVQLMDFRVPQPAHGLAFGYVLPLGPRDALVEYTQFSRTPLSRPEYEAALEQYTRDVLCLGRFESRSVEAGVIPMTDARFARRIGPAVHRIGAVGGATRPATGYTFSAVQRQSKAVAAALRDGKEPRLRAPHGRRALAMDAVMLRALDTGRVNGPDFFTRLFRRMPAERVLRFLDGRTGLREDVLLGLATPVGPMLRTAAELPFLPRTPFPFPHEESTG
ncbi:MULTISPECIES: lycopene cyclase family protein [unclassified Streptomyces]|uniref:lycopene cyclase family protein n=1 Tax=unclassified Streptomyces TaxID=2593676 RepID=UPI001B362BED|nr:MULTISPECIES: lycopene cyclase family protein [unclassified Streptomyces]MBQ0862243.1 lycopene cyclase [Streptomyces sp. RK75]MBQ1121767.1 lycopene cyclase [Streptomyces sp. B15]